MQELTILFSEVLCIAFFLWKSLGEPEEVRLYPQALLVLMIVCLIPSLAAAFRNRGRSGNSGAPGETRNRLLAVVLFFLYLLSMNHLGFLLATTLFFVLWLSLLEKRLSVRNVVVPVLFAPVMFYLFHGLLNVPLPGGVVESLLGIRM